MTGAPAQAVETLGSHRAILVAGARFRYSTFFAPYRNVRGEWVSRRERGSRLSTWEVLRVEDRGVVVGHPIDGSFGTAGGHQHLAEWITELAYFEPL